MKFFNKPISKREIKELSKKHGDYIKVTVDLDSGWLVAGCQLHTDGEKILLEKGSHQDNIWGGGVSLKTKEIDASAVLNLRPRLDNFTLELIDPQKRERLIKIVRKIFKEL